MKKIIYFVRHAQSLSNAGWVWEWSYQDVPLTEKWHWQARKIADFFTQAPDLIAHTTFLRTKETATPLMERYPHIPVEILPIHEFTYLNTQTYAGTTVYERREKAMGYWNKNDPYHNDGGGAESFVDCINRILHTFPRLMAKKEESIVVFTHGQILQLMRLLLSPGMNTQRSQDIMRSYHINERENPIKNGEILKVTVDDDGNWSQMESVFVPEEK